VLHIGDAELCRMQHLGELADYTIVMLARTGSAALRRSA
jgi:hypothetical protein